MTPREQQLTTMLEKLLIWDKKWPLSATRMNVVQVEKAELELDDLMTEAKQMLGVA